MGGGAGGKHQGLEAYPSIEDIAESPPEGDAKSIKSAGGLIY
jgi:hypothetical protein